MRTIVVTGGIGSGKSAVCGLLREKGIPVYDADSRTKALYHGDLLARIESAFGRSFRLAASSSGPALSASSSGSSAPSSSGSSAPSFPGSSRESSVPAVDFAALASVAFASDEALARLEAIVHPAVRDDFLAWRDARPDAPLVALESAIILDKPLFDGLYDTVVLVYAPVEDCVARVLARNPGLTEDAVRRRIAAQSAGPSGALSSAFSRADYLLINDGPLAALAPQVDALLAALS